MTDKNSLLIIIPFICLMSLGLVMVASSSIYVADDLTGNMPTENMVNYFIGKDIETGVDKAEFDQSMLHAAKVFPI